MSSVQARASVRFARGLGYPEDLIEKLKGDDDDYQVDGEEVEPSDRVLRSAKRQRQGV